MKTNQANLESQENNSNNKNGSKNGNGGKIYHTHDGRYKQTSKQQSSSKGTTNIIKTQDQSSVSYTYNNQQQKVVSGGNFKQSGQKNNNATNFAQSHNQVKIVKNQTNENEINPLVNANK